MTDPSAVITTMSVATVVLSAFVTLIMLAAAFLRPGLAIRLSALTSLSLTVIAAVVWRFAAAHPGDPVPADEALAGRLVILVAIIVPQVVFATLWAFGRFGTD